MRYEADINIEKKRFEFFKEDALHDAFYITFDLIRDTPEDILLKIIQARFDEEDKLKKPLTSN